MIQNTKTRQKIAHTKQELVRQNDSLNEYLDALIKEKPSLTEGDRQVIREIRDKNLETIQLIDKMHYRGIVSL